MLPHKLEGQHPELLKRFIDKGRARHVCGKVGLTVWWVTGVLISLPSGAPAADIPQIRLPLAEEVVQRMSEMNQWRRSALRQYTSNRRYVAENVRFDKHAEVKVREKYVFPGKKELETLSESGSGYIRREVISKLIEAEVEASKSEIRDQTQVTVENYKFELMGTEKQGGRLCFLITVIPKFPKKYLMKGQIWVDQEDFAIVRMEGSPAKNPSFWTRKVKFTRRYQKHGPFWLADSVESESELFLAGKSSLKIEYFDYVITQAESNAVTASGNGQ
jgi:hypothetical protein